MVDRFELIFFFLNFFLFLVSGINFMKFRNFEVRNKNGI